MSVTPNGNSNLATSVSYASSWAVTSVTGPNSSTASTTYDSAGRPQTSTSTDGAVTNYSYAYNPNIQTASVSAPANGTTVTQWKKTFLDGFGRVTAVQTGHDNSTSDIIEVDTQYAPCARSPLGKLWRTSLPFAPGATVLWTTNTYDGSGRTLTVTKPDGVSRTTYAYSGNTTTVMDPAGKWKTSTTDALGNLVSVSEADPNNQPGGTLVTSYTYNGVNQLTQVSMPRSNGTQTRTFQYTGSDLTSATNPENGTVTYQYDGAHHVTLRTDAKGQQTHYSYDPYGRLSTVQHSPAGSNGSGSPDVTYYYDTNPFDSNFSQNSWGRLTAVTFGGMSFPYYTSGGTTYIMTLNPTYMYSYNGAGRVTDQRFRINRDVTNDASPQDFDFEATYATPKSVRWDNLGRMTSRGGPDANFTYAYDAMGRLSTMSGGASGSVQYTPTGQVATLTYDGLTETRTYNSLMQLTHQTVPGMMDMQYIYPSQNNGRISQSIDGISGETVNYTYDALNRLSTAGAASGSWSQQYTFDGFGNLTGMQGAAVWSYDPATNRKVGVAYDANGLPGSGHSYDPSWDMENRMVQNGSGMSYSYDPYGKRVFRVSGAGQLATIGPVLADFYTISGQKISTIQCTSWCFMTGSANVYFAGKLIRSNGVTVVTDRLGSVRANTNGERMSYYPYGQEKTSTADNREKFGTYFRDGPGQDYADQRYYNQQGAFWSPDPYQANNGGNGDPSDPASWNRYSYAGGDPINYYDPRGLMTSSAGGGQGGGGNGDDGGGDGGDDGCENTKAGCGTHGGGGNETLLPENTGEAAGGGNLENYQRALDSLKTFSTSSKDCLKDLNAVGLTESAVDSLASKVRFVSYTEATTSQQRAAISGGADLMTNYVINTIYYVTPNLSDAKFPILMGEMLHELIHDSGFGSDGGPSPLQDTALQKALHLKQNPDDTTNISKKLAKDCFKGAK